jgi:hypothetical protein
MGKVLLEKLLYSCSDLNQIFLLMRPKRGKTGEQRVQEFAQVPVRNKKFICNEKRLILNSNSRYFIALKINPRRCLRKSFQCMVILLAIIWA